MYRSAIKLSNFSCRQTGSSTRLQAAPHTAELSTRPPSETQAAWYTPHARKLPGEHLHRGRATPPPASGGAAVWSTLVPPEPQRSPAHPQKSGLQCGGLAAHTSPQRRPHPRSWPCPACSQHVAMLQLAAPKALLVHDGCIMRWLVEHGLAKKRLLLEIQFCICGLNCESSRGLHT